MPHSADTPTLLPPERLAEIKGRCDAAQPASLNARATVTFETDIPEHIGIKVVEMLGHAPRDIPALLDHISALTRERDSAFERGASHAWESAAKIVEAQDGMSGWKRRIVEMFRAAAALKE